MNLDAVVLNHTEAGPALVLEAYPMRHGSLHLRVIGRTRSRAGRGLVLPGVVTVRAQDGLTAFRIMKFFWKESRFGGARWHRCRVRALPWRTTERAGVSSDAIRKAATRPTMVSAVPSLDERFLASVSEPPTRLARSAAVVTDAPSSVPPIAFSTAAASSPSAARTGYLGGPERAREWQGDPRRAIPHRNRRPWARIPTSYHKSPPLTVTALENPLLHH